MGHLEMTTQPTLTTKNLSLNNGQSTLASSFLGSVTQGTQRNRNYSVYDSGDQAAFISCSTARNWPAARYSSPSPRRSSLSLQYVAGALEAGTETTGFRAYNGMG